MIPSLLGKCRSEELLFETFDFRQQFLLFLNQFIDGSDNANYETLIDLPRDFRGIFPAFY